MATRLTVSTFNRAVRSALSNLNEILSDLNNVDPNHPEAQNQYSSLLDVLHERYAEISPRLEAYFNLDPLPENLTEDQLDKDLQTVTSLHSKILKSLKLHLKNSSPTVNDRSFQAAPNNSLISLPKFDIPKFNGVLHQWENFFSRFESLIHSNKSLSVLQKYQFLLSLLGPEPLKVIEHLSLTEANYSVSLDCLRDRYHNPRRVVIYHAEQLLNLPTFDSRSVAGMREFLDKFNANYKALLNIPNQDTFMSIFTTHLLSKLDNNAKSRFELVYCKPNEFPTVNDIMNVLQTLVVQRENTALISSNPARPISDSAPNRSRVQRVCAVANKSSSLSHCVICQSSAHSIYACSKLLAKSPHDRFNCVRNLKLCTNCLGDHNSSKCLSKNVCRTCSKKHHTLLHFNVAERPASPVDSSLSNSPGSSQALVQSTTTSVIQANATFNRPSTVLMSTCLVRLQISSDNYIVARAVLDSASESSFLSEHCAQTLKVKRFSCSSVISGVGNTLSKSSGMCHISLATLKGDIIAKSHPFLILPRLTANTPALQIASLVREAAQGFALADPTFDQSCPIDVLLGADITAAVLLSAPYSLGPELPFIIKTSFGHVLMGEAPVYTQSCNAACVQPFVPQQADQVTLSSLHRDYHNSPVVTSSLLTITGHSDLVQSLQRFWDIDEPPPFKPVKAAADIACEDYYLSTTSRDSSGRYMVRLPFKESSNSLGNSYQPALTRFRSLEQKFKSNPTFHDQYITFMRDYEEQGHMRPVPSSALTHYFIPHHGIFKTHGDTSKLRVVFDASAKSSNGCSLNDLLYAGPKLQTMISDIITLFRKYPYVIVTDLCKMFRQIRVHEDDQPFQCILWRERSDMPIKMYYLTTVTYGVSSSPYLALRTLRQLAHDEGQNFPIAASVLRDQTFVDDILCGANSIADLLSLRNDLITLLSKGGFTLKKWSSNHPDALIDIPVDDREPILNSPNGSFTRILGLIWDITSDKFMYDSSCVSVPNINSRLTKRSILSQIAQIYDPNGWLSPIVIKAKCFLQKLWLHPLDWDSELSSDLAEEWHSFVQALSGLSDICVSRPLCDFASVYQLHGFSDASMHGYSAVIYLRSVSSEPRVTIIASKTRVKPVKAPTLPRLELMGAHLLAKLVSHHLSLFRNHITVESVHLWCDSTIVLDWIKIPPIQLKPFVGNRVAEILEVSDPSMWRHVASEDNPADVASRGCTPSQLKYHPLWWTGPSWLISDPTDWPQLARPSKVSEDVTSEIKTTSLAVTTSTSHCELFSRCSSWPKLVQVFWAAYVPCEAQFKDAVQMTLEQIDVIRRLTDKYRPTLTLCISASDIVAAHATQKMCSLIGVEGGHSLASSLSVLRTLYAVGVRYLTLTSTCNTPWADCSYVDNPDRSPEHNGLTGFGKSIVKEMNRLGMIVDLSHVSVKTMKDALAVSKAPVIFSHSSARALCNDTRNVPDQILRLLALNGGVVMVNFYSQFLTCKDASTLRDAVSHIEHVRKIAGVDNVGLGAGYDGINLTPEGLEDVSSYPALFAHLIASGRWSVEDLKKLAGLNFLRVLKEVEKVRDSMDEAGVAPYEDSPPPRPPDNCTTPYHI